MLTIVESYYCVIRRRCRKEQLNIQISRHRFTLSLLFSFTFSIHQSIAL